MKLIVDVRHVRGERNPMLYGHFIEHFHRQIYGGVYDPSSHLADDEGFRTDVLEAMRRIKVPILRWPGGCFVSCHHWKDGVGPQRRPSFDKAWRVEDPNTFGTDEYISLCRKVGCEPYICTNAGTGSTEEMSDWVEYCNLECEGYYARQRIQNGHTLPHKVKYWSVGNENYGRWEIGAKAAGEWGRLVEEAAKMIRRVDPTVELTAAALADLDWNIDLLRSAGDRLSWISLHDYWDKIQHTNDYGSYEQCMGYTTELEDSVAKVRGLLAAMGLQGRIKVAFDEWNLRGWYHPNIHTVYQGLTPDEYLSPRDLNDDNSHYTMADAVFSACFLNMCNRNCDIVGMANFAPIVNTRGCIYTHDNGVVLRSTYHVFDLYVNLLGPTVLQSWSEEVPMGDFPQRGGGTAQVELVDLLATLSPQGEVVLAAVNKHPTQSQELNIEWQGGYLPAYCKVHILSGNGTDDYNDIGRDSVVPIESDWEPVSGDTPIALPPHSVNILRFSCQPCR